MTDQSTIELTNAITLPEPSELPALYRNGEIDTILTRIETEAMAIAPDLSTAKGRKEIASLAHKVARSKTALDEAGKKLTEERRRQIDAVNAERKKVRDRLDALKGKVRKPLDDWEAAEEARKQGHRNRLALFQMDRTDWQMASEDIAKIIDEAEAIEIGPEWEEFEAMAEEAKGEALTKFRSDLRAALGREEQAAELERLRKAEAEREAKEREEAERREKEEAEQLEQERAEQRKKDHAKFVMDCIAECREGAIGGVSQVNTVLIHELETTIAAEITEEKVGDQLDAIEALRLAAIDTLQQRQEAEQREAARRAEEERRLAEEDARDKALAEEKVRREREAEEKRKAREKREKNARHRAKIKREIRASIEGMDLDEVTDALISGAVAHCIVEI